MYIRIEFQYGNQDEVRMWEGEWLESNYQGSPAEALRSFCQFSEGYEPHGWIADNMTEAEFDQKFEAGQRLFYLADGSGHALLVRMWKDGESGNFWKERSDFEKLAHDLTEAYDSLVCDTHNYLTGEESTPRAKFEELFKGYKEFDENRDLKKLTDHLMKTY